MKLFLDCEFNGWKGDLISLALVPIDDSASFYQAIELPEDTVIDPWVKQNVIPILHVLPVSAYHFTELLKRYLNQWPTVTIVADWPDDIRYFCQELITSPGKMFGAPLLNFELRRLDITPVVPHNALSDAQAIKEAYLDKYPNYELP